MSLNHKQKLIHFHMVTYIHKCGQKLRMNSTTVATASHIYHKFFSICSDADYEPELIAATALYLAGKAEEKHVKLRDVVNVCHRALHPDEPPLDVGERFWNLRDSITQCELFVLRVLQFRVQIDHPHKYLLHYLQSLYHWLDPKVTNDVPIARVAWAMVRDSYHTNICLRYKPEDIAVTMVYFTMQIYGLEVPCNRQSTAPWWEVLHDKVNMNTMRDIVSDLTDMYDLQEYS